MFGRSEGGSAGRWWRRRRVPFRVLRAAPHRTPTAKEKTKETVGSGQPDPEWVRLGRGMKDVYTCVRGYASASVKAMATRWRFALNSSRAVVGGRENSGTTL